MVGAVVEDEAMQLAPTSRSGIPSGVVQDFRLLPREGASCVMSNDDGGACAVAMRCRDFGWWWLLEAMGRWHGRARGSSGKSLARLLPARTTLSGVATFLEALSWRLFPF
uniref:Uncharacterized protein n=1 Tax=Oryza punctata TaxID=4537 RepID=A0A0E0KZ26_ORYPU